MAFDLHCVRAMKHPVRLSWPAVEPTDVRPARTTRSGTFAKQHLVLVVDDRAENRELCRECLSYSGFAVIEATDGAKAVQAAREHLPDVIVMDVAMPIMDGYEACRIIKADPLTSYIPVVFLTATPARSAVADEGADIEALLLKPCSPDDLEAEVRKWSEIGRARKLSGKSARSGT
jgi:CheY-like chemotaxis protein